MIKLASIEELENMKEIVKAENSVHKAQAYLVELQDNVQEARKRLSGNPQIIDLVNDKSVENVETKKRKMPDRSSKDKSHNYAGNKSESENENDLIPYKIPRKNKNDETNDEVRLSFNIQFNLNHVSN